MISSQEIQTVTFSKPPIGKRGYNEDEVDAFLDHLDAGVQEWENTLASQQREIDELRRRPVDPERTPIQMAPAPPPPAQEPPSLQAARVLEAAERTADSVVAQAEEISERAIREANEKAAEIAAAARYEASKLVDSARTEAAEIEQRLTQLRQFEQTYRNRLDTYIESQLFALRADGEVEPPS